MKKYKHNYIKELWWNRPWVYLPSVCRFMKRYSYKPGKGDNLRIWLRNCFYINWQVCLEPMED